MSDAAFPYEVIVKNALIQARGVVSAPDIAIAKALIPILKKSKGWISETAAEALKEKYKISENEFLLAVAEAAKTFAIAPISKYRVGQAARAGSGRVYWAVNLEFQGFALNHTVHSEQYMVSLLKLHGEKQLKTLALLGPPCGHCRQFLRELENWNDVKFLIPEHPPYFLSELLPFSFGPEELGTQGAVLGSKEWNLKYAAARDFLRILPHTTAEKLLQTAQFSYAPYTKSPSAVLLVDKFGNGYRGMNIDNVAFNPSMNAFSVAMVDLVSRSGKLKDISYVYVAELQKTKSSQLEMIRGVVGAYTSAKKITVLPIELAD